MNKEGSRVYMLLKQILKHHNSKQHDAGTKMRMWAVEAQG